MGSGKRNSTRAFEVEEAARRLARRQYGVISLGQARALGLSRQAVYRRVRSGRWHRLLPAVFRLEGAPQSFRQYAMAAVLWSGAGAVARRTAGALHALSGLSEGGLIELITTRAYDGPAPIRILSRPQLEPSEVVAVDGIPSTTPIRTWFDLAAIYPDVRVERWLDELLRRRLASLDDVLVNFGSLAARGRNGIGRARRILAERDPALGIPQSELETDFARLARRFGLPAHVSQFGVEVGGRTALLDFAYPDVLLGIEVDSWLHHSDRPAFESDRARADELVAVGWRILHYTARQIRLRAQWVAETTLAAHRAATRANL